MNDLVALAAGILFGLVMIALCGAFVKRANKRRSAKSSARNVASTVFLFDANGQLLDTTPDAREVVHAPLNEGFTWIDLHRVFAPRFPNLPETLPTKPLILCSEDLSPTEMEVTLDESLIRVTLRSEPMGAVSQHQFLVQSDELDRLNIAFDVAPNPIWATGSEGEVLWCNAAFETLTQNAHPDHGAPALEALPKGDGKQPQNTRMQIEQTDGTSRWFEITSRQTPHGTMHFATDIDTLIEAELAQRNFVQTLAKTFAHLPIGLAVFDRERRLVLFNPALVDLTRLPMDFLSARPNLLSFFDHMRENRMMPEPKNYATWREQLTDVITAARDDRYCETWSLASGLTYKITGRPHPDGAVAFLLEDISAEISLTRRFRSELELTQSVIDCMPDAVAVFSRLGVLTFCNVSYRLFWECDPDSAFNETTIAEATETWQRGCEASDIWPELRDYILTLQDRTPWSAGLKLRDGRNLYCHIEPVSAGATMVRFTFAASRRRESPQTPSTHRAIGG